MSQTSVNVRMDEKLKEQFDDFCENTGMTMTTAICIFVKKVVSEQRIPFEISVNDPFYSSANMKRIEKAIKDIENGKAKKHDLIEDDDE